jgi:hypothetical protein
MVILDQCNLHKPNSLSRTHYQYIEKTASEMPGRPFRRLLKWEGKLNEARNLTTKKFGRSTSQALESMNYTARD